jgi:hypothetical protein
MAGIYGDPPLGRVEMRMAQRELEQWICQQNIAQYRVRLDDPAEKAHHIQVETLLSRELAKLQAMFPD